MNSTLLGTDKRKATIKKPTYSEKYSHPLQKLQAQYFEIELALVRVTCLIGTGCPRFFGKGLSTPLIPFPFHVVWFGDVDW